MEDSFFQSNFKRRSKYSHFAGNEAKPGWVNDEVRWSLCVLANRFVQIPSRTYLSRVDSELFHYAGRWSVVISGTVRSAAVTTDLIVSGFMATLMVHLALTRPDGACRGALSRMCARARARDNTEISC